VRGTSFEFQKSALPDIVNRKEPRLSKNAKIALKIARKSQNDNDFSFFKKTIVEDRATISKAQQRTSKQ
jgi:hypothetical protein